MPEPAATNAPELTVSELSSALKRTIEDRFGYVRLRGEISNYRGPHSSGHAYFCLKDANARIDAVIWKGAFSRLRIKPEEGLEVIATGKITTFPGKSSYQIVIEAIGARRRRRADGAARGAPQASSPPRACSTRRASKTLPFLPRVIGVVTSPTGAVIRDILHRLSDRFPRHVLVWPVRVQGETSAAEVAAAIAGFNALPRTGAIPRPDVLIVARGGGSLEDLWSFNEEIVVRAAAASLIPLISAIGHETDWTLIDHVADLRAPTPTGAAEKAVPVRARTAGRSRRSGAAATPAPCLRLIERRRAELRALARALPLAGGDRSPCRASASTSPRAISPTPSCAHRTAAASASRARRSGSRDSRRRQDWAAHRRTRGARSADEAVAGHRRRAARRKGRKPRPPPRQCAPGSGPHGARSASAPAAIAWRFSMRACGRPRAQISPPERRGSRVSISCLQALAIKMCWRAASRWCATPRTSRCAARPKSSMARF